MTIVLPKRSLFDVLVTEPLDLAKSQPHQILLSTGSVALMGQFAGASRIVDPLVGYCIAIGVEWAYLRGLASDSRANTKWGGILNWSAFGIVVLWGVLWCAQQFSVFNESAGGWWLAAAHVLPVAWLSLCSAQCHRAAAAAERQILLQDEADRRERERTAVEARRAFELEQEQKDRDLARWKEAYQLKQAIKAAPAAEMPEAKMAIMPETKGKTARCAKCKKDVAWDTPSEAGTIRRWGCAECRAKSKEVV